MTAIKPIENRHVRSVASERYPTNPICAHPECNEAAVDPHHAFPRSAIAGDSYFVEITDDEGAATVIPHVTGLCRAHHDDVEQHRAWIKLEDGIFTWFDRKPAPDHLGGSESNDSWRTVGPLAPQPGGRDKVTKRKRKKFQGEARRNRQTFSIKVPKDALEDGAGLLFDYIAQVEERRGFDPPRPPYYTLIDALAYTALNAGAEDFA